MHLGKPSCVRCSRGFCCQLEQAISEKGPLLLRVALEMNVVKSMASRDVNGNVYIILYNMIIGINICYNKLQSYILCRY